MTDNFSFSIEKHLGKISDDKSSWPMELNLVSWSNHPAKYDLRPWSPDHQKMGKGVTFTAEELKNLKDLLNSLEIQG